MMHGHHGQLSLFSGVGQYRVFSYAMAFLVLSEVAIWLYTLKGRGNKEQREDRGSVWIVLFAWFWGALSGGQFRSEDMPKICQRLLFPEMFFYLGLFMIGVGVLVRGSAVLTLKEAFTHQVQTGERQKLVQTGLYAWVRNPAYTGSLISLMGITLAYRSVLAAVTTFIVCLICYGFRIRVEEAALRAHFKETFEAYCRHTPYRLIPKIY